MKKAGQFLLFGSLVAMMSCESDIVDPSDTVISAEPIIALPIGEVGLTLEHLFAPDDSLIFANNATYQVVVAQDSVFSIQVSDLISLPAQSPSNTSISMGIISVDPVSTTQGISLGTVANDIGGAFQAGINGTNGTTAPFPAFSETNVGTYGGGGFGTFNSASFSGGSLELQIANNWPVPVDMNVNLVDASNGNTILNYNLPNVMPGSTGSATQSLVNVSLPSTVAFQIASISSAGSLSAPIDTTDLLDLTINGTNLEVYAAEAVLATQALSADTQFVNLGTGGSEELRELYLNTASFEFDFTSTIAEDIQLQLSFPGSDKNGSTVDTTIIITSGATTSGAINLNGTTLDLTTDPSQPHSKLPISIAATLLGSGNMVTVDSSDALDMTFEMTNLQFGHILGYFGQQQITIDNGAVDLAIEFLDNFDGNITFAEPSITFDITNSIGLPIQLDLDFQAYADGTAFPLNGPAQVLPYPTVLGNTETGSLVYDNTNSQITSVFTLPKDSIVYGGQVNVNHDTTTYGTDNFVTSDGAISGNLTLELPFYFTATGLAFGDTLAQNRSPYTLPAGASVEYAKLLMQATTTLPLDASMDLKFYDANWNLILVQSMPLLESGTPDANGNITTPNTLNTSLDLDATEMQAVFDAAHILVEATMETANAGNDPVRLRTDATINLAFGIELKVNYLQ